MNPRSALPSRWSTPWTEQAAAISNQPPSAPRLEDNPPTFNTAALAAPPQLRIRVRILLAVARSVQDIIEQADGLAALFEGYEPKPDDDVDVSEYLRRRVTVSAAASETDR